MSNYGRKTIFDNRYTYVYIVTFLVTIVLLYSLFNLQIINGEEYRSRSEKRLLREKVVEAPRGEVYDRNGNTLISNTMGFKLLIYRTKISSEQLNSSLKTIVGILDKNSDKYSDSLPIEILNNQVVFTFQNDDDKSKENDWKKKNNFKIELSAKDILNKLKEKYKVEETDLVILRKIVGQRYEIVQRGYSSFRPYEIATNVSRQTVNEIEEQNMNLPGVNISTVPIREYVRGNLASHILGYTGKVSQNELDSRKDSGYTQNDDIGKTGIELVFEKYLRGTKGIKKVEMDSSGRINEEYQTTESIKGNDLILTIDANLQQIAEQALAANINKIATGGFSKTYSDANAGSCVVIDVKTGEILAMASYPTYDPSLFIGGITKEDWNRLNNDSAKPMFNRSIQAAYAPGSTFKMVTAIAGLESGAITTTEKIEDTGIYPRAHNPRCWIYTSYGRTHGFVNVSEAIKTSCNCYFYETGYRMGIDTLERYAKYFGLGTKLGIELPGEVSGVLAGREYSNLKKNTWYISDTLSASIGQSYNSFTPLQLANYISILANGGTNHRPTLVKNVVTPEGVNYSNQEIIDYVNGTLNIETKEIEQLDFSKENIEAVLNGMREVTDEAGGTAYGIFSKLPVKVGGKTGTAESSSGSSNGVFVGFAPFENPEIAVAVVVEHGGHGSYTAEVVRDVMNEYFGVNALNINENRNIGTVGNGII